MKRMRLIPAFILLAAAMPAAAMPAAGRLRKKGGKCIGNQIYVAHTNDTPVTVWIGAAWNAEPHIIKPKSKTTEPHTTKQNPGD